jgi:hypothetical protein
MWVDMKNEDTVDLSSPFLAIVPEAADGGYFDKTNAVYLVNPLDSELTNVAIRTGGFFSDDEGVIEAKPVDMEPLNVAAHSAEVIEMTSSDEFDELDCWWNIAYTVDGERKRASFDAGKGLRGTTWVEDVPVLGRGACVVTQAS